MYDDEEHRCYADLPRLEPIIEQQDDEMTSSPMSNPSIDASYFEKQQRTHTEIQQFEELEKELSSNRYGIRVKFDDEQTLPITQTTIIKTEPCFQVNSIEDQVTKHFYENEYQWKDDQLSKSSSSKTSTEYDNLDEEYFLTVKQKKNLSDKQDDQISNSSAGKSILKKSSKNGKVSISRSPSPSPALLNKKPTSSNQFEHLAEVTSKQTTSPLSCRSLFEPTINIFDTSNSSTYRSSRLRYYIKPYRGDVYIPPPINTRQSRSLSEQRLTHQSEPIVWYTFANQYSRPLTKRQHVSWSPVREYIRQGREKLMKIPRQKKEQITSARSSSHPCLQSSSSSLIPISIRYQSFENPKHICQSYPSSSIDSNETSSIRDYSLTSNSQNDEKKEILFTSPLPDIVHLEKKEHTETMQRYDRLLEKMRATDEQLQLLSRSWTNKTEPKILSRSNLSLNKPTKKKEFLSPMILQICLIVLVIFNLFIVYFFHDITHFWSHYVTHTKIVEEHDG